MFKYCIAPSCLNSNYNMPNKLFISVPKNPELRKKWCRAVKRESVLFSPKSTLFVCEDHFNLREDLENYVRFSLMGGKLHIKKEVVPHLFPQTRTNTSQIDQKIVDTYNENNMRFIKSSSSRQCKTCASTAAATRKPKRRRIQREVVQLPNTSGSNSEIREEHIQNNDRINEELDMRENSVSVPIQNEICNNQSVVENATTECNDVLIKTECEDNNDKSESMVIETDSDINECTNMVIKHECEETDERMECNTNDSSNVSIKTECTNTNDNTETDKECNTNESSNMVIKTEHENTQDNADRNAEETDTSCIINNSSNVLIRNECVNSNESNIEQIGREGNTNEASSVSIKSECENSNNNIINIIQPSTECNKVDSSNVSCTTECTNVNNDCEQSGTDVNEVYCVKMERNTNDPCVERTPENNNGNIIIVTNGFITTPNSDENVIESNIFIEETNNIITYRQNEFVSVNEENTVYKKVCTNGEIEKTSSLNHNNKMSSDMSQFHCTGNLFHCDNWLADWFVTCMVPQCSNTFKYNPSTRFFQSPKDGRWETWLKAIYLNPDIFEHKTTYYICEDHFDLPNDLENWENFQKNREQPRMKPGVLPSPTVVQPKCDEETCRKRKLHKNNITILK